MAEKDSNWFESGAKTYRNFNILGAGATFGAGVVFETIAQPEAAVISYTLAGINVIQALGAEFVRRIGKGFKKPALQAT